MLLNLFILICLVWSFFIGYSRGLILQIIYSCATILAALVAAGNYQPLALKLSSWVPFSSATASSHFLIFDDNLLFHADKAFYAAVAFLAIYALIYGLVRFVGLFLHFTLLPFGKRGKVAAGILALCAVYFGWQMILTTLALVPMATIQNQLHASFLARLMIEHTPISSGLLQSLFIENIVHLKAF